MLKSSFFANSSRLKVKLKYRGFNSTKSDFAALVSEGILLLLGFKSRAKTAVKAAVWGFCTAHNSAT